jgi:GT2 family glycosyltransferase
MSSNAPLVYIVTLNWNGWHDTAKCLDSVRGLGYPNYSVVAIDNGSQDDSVEQLRNWAAAKVVLTAYDRKEAENGGRESEEIILSRVEGGKALTLICSEENLGYAEGCNLGITYALKRGADYVFILNNDATISPDALDHLVETARSANAGVVGARVLDETGSFELYAGRSWPRQVFGPGRIIADRSHSFWSSSDAEGSAILLRRDLLEQRISECGYYFDPTFFMYCEDIDLSLYAQARGYRCVISRDAVVNHGLANSSGGKGNPRSLYYITRNRIYLANLWLALPVKVAFHLYYAPSRVALQLYRSVRKTAIKPQRAVLGGLLDGYRGVRGKWAEHEA